jgi:hypothetical protein
MPEAKKPAKRTVPRQSPTTVVDTTVREYLMNRSMREKSETVEGNLKKQLMDAIEQQGTLKEGGHREIELGAAQTFPSYKGGKSIIKTITGIERKRRVSQSLNEDRTMAMLKEKGMLDECTEVVVVLNEDAVLAANYDGRIKDDELSALYDESESFAFYLVEGSADA